MTAVQTVHMFTAGSFGITKLCISTENNTNSLSNIRVDKQLENYLVRGVGVTLNTEPCLLHISFYHFLTEFYICSLLVLYVNSSDMLYRIRFIYLLFDAFEHVYVSVLIFYHCVGSSHIVISRLYLLRVCAQVDTWLISTSISLRVWIVNYISRHL